MKARELPGIANLTGGRCHELPYGFFGFGPDTATVPKPGDKLAVPNRNLAKVGLAHPGAGQVVFDFFEKSGMSHAPIISALADRSSVHDSGRDSRSWPLLKGGMNSESWRERLEAAIESSGQSLRDVSLRAGVSPGYDSGCVAASSLALPNYPRLRIFLLTIRDGGHMVVLNRGERHDTR